MYVRGASTFDVVATPAPRSSPTDNSVVYNGLASFEEDGDTHEYSLVDGTAYYTRRPGGTDATAPTPAESGCLPSHFVPPIETVLSAIHNAKTATHHVASIAAETTCPGGSLLVFPFAGEDFVLCSKRSSSSVVSSGSSRSPGLSWLQDDGFKIFGSDMNIDVKSSKDYGLTEDDSTNYFGSKIPDHSPCCTSIKYITLATQLNAWNNATFQKRLVDLVLHVSDSSDVATRTIKDTIIVAHSMANLVLGGAIASGMTILDTTSTWVGTSGPMEGSMGSNYLYETCDGALTVVVSGLMKLFGGCPPKPGRASLAYQGSNYSNGKLDHDFTAAQAAYSTNVSAVLCSKNHTGLATIQAAIYKLAANVVPHKSPYNDGIVEFESCSMGLPDEQFGSSSNSKFYETSLNHVDAAFRYGDSLFNDKKRPVKWFECLL
ncbi:hypothetical protein BBJ29_005193 [Phytophthora kernoviae]|uniref:Uncharacterized protein n=1 Tax=Phytophthora kernoviae TaxID=325452 RepID=A0A3F2RMG7_9STRA|nr:hypothetical protein BBJ29_005193 [Phytophthora kernoviae]RLN60529.1 hypothetical protein BBP00_00005933 [Phytophthora kernoviae]